MNRKNLALYIHWPFCLKKCPYCDFNSHVRDDIDYNKWLNAYLNEINLFQADLKNKNITSIFFGGGTPSLMPAFIPEKIINHLAKYAVLDDNIEITLEANPTSIEAEKFKDFSAIGINRVSIGVQSFNDQYLKFLGREHSSNQALNAISIAEKYFKNYSFDLIYALPNQTAEQWEKELNFALTISNYHLSLYQLTIEKGTEFFSQYKKGDFTLPNDEQAGELYNLTRDITEKNQFFDYEISNYAKKGYESKHNLAYWQYNEYLGLGPGAHSRINNQEIVMIYNPEKWLSSIENNQKSIMKTTNLTKKEQVYEFLLMGLRLKSGINLKDLSARFDINISDFLKMDKIDHLINGNLLMKNDQQLIITTKGRVLLNKIIEYIL
jgi:putative oxygen-independent coproporphyrinogen III oxidase